MASELYEVRTSATSTALTQASYGTQAILGASNRFSQRYKVYPVSGSTPMAAFEADGFLPTDPEHRAFTRAISSKQRPAQILVAQVRNRPTQAWRLVPYGTIAVGKQYGVRVAGRDVLYTTPAGPPALSALLTGLKAAVDAALAVAPAITTCTTAATSTAVALTASGPGVFVPVVCTTRDTLTVEQSHADPGIADDLSGLLVDTQKANGAADWYAINLCFASTDTAMATAAWAEANRRLFVLSTQDTRAVRAPVPGDLDVISRLLALNYRQTAVLWHHDVDQMAAAGWCGRMLPLPAGTETWADKTIGGLEASDLVGDELVQLRARRATYYRTVHGRALTVGKPGAQVLNGEYIDNVRGLAEVDSRLGEAWTLLKADVDLKSTYDDDGIQADGMTLERLLKSYESGKGAPRLFRAGSVVFTAVRLDSIPAGTAGERINLYTWKALLANASHKADVTGVVTS